MAKLSELKQDLFLPEIARLPQGRYVHFVVMRETESFPVFQTDGTLNVIRVRAGLKNDETISRLVLFKRKQSSPERLTGRELLRSLKIISGDKNAEAYCEYNSQDFCKKCPDCIHYGYAIGDQGAEKSKVLTDSAFSISAYDVSHKAFSFNALYEHGTMTDEKGKTRSSFGEQDHVVPQVFFPSVETLRDPTYEGFLYVLGNLLRTDRYGAQETRTGKVHNHLLAICFANGEIFSNLRFTQAIYDEMGGSEAPLSPKKVLAAASKAYGELISNEPVSHQPEFVDNDLMELLADVTALYQNNTETRKLLETLDKKTRQYAQGSGAPEKKGKGKKGEA